MVLAAEWAVIASAGPGIATTASAAPAEPIRRLFYTLVSISVAIFAGFLMARLKLVVPDRGDMKALALLTGQIAFPLVVFRTVATANIGDVDFGVVVACTLGKVAVMSFIWISAYFVYEVHRPKGQRMLTATVFAFFVVASNDFAIGFPVIQALYGDRKDVDMSVYIASNALVGSIFFTPLTMVLFAVGDSFLQRRDGEGSGEGRSGCRQCLWVTLDILLNPVIICTILGLLYKAVFGSSSLPGIISQSLDLLTAPFPMGALFLTGASLRTPKVTLWPALLALLKVVVCAFLSYAVGGLLLRGSSNLVLTLQNFTFFYGSIPSSSAPLIFALKFAPSAEQLIATATLIGLVLGGPIMFMTALLLENEMQSMEPFLRAVQLSTSIASVLSGLIILMLVFCIGKAWGFLCVGRQLVLAYACTAFLYQVLMTVMNPNSVAAHCEAYNSISRHSWFTVTPMTCAIGCLQHMSRLMLLFLLYMLVNHGHDEMFTTVRAACKVTLPIVVMCFFLAIPPSILTYPSTINEICGFDFSDRALSKLALNGLWSFTLLSITTGLIVKKLSLRRSARAAAVESGAFSTSADLSENLCNIAEDEASTPWICKPPRQVIRILTTIVILRYVTQVLNCSHIFWERIFGSGTLGVMGSFAQMLVLETILEHGQPIFLLVALALDENFLPHIVVILRKRRVAGFLKRSPVVSIHTYYARSEDSDRDLQTPVSLPRL